MSTIKDTVKGALRRFGWELRPLSMSFEERQRTLLAGSDLVLDVGANTGQFAESVRDLGYRGRLISFEPERAAFAALSEASAADGSWDVRRVALADRDGEAALSVSANSVSSSLLTILEEHVSAAPHSRVVGHQVVPTSTLDSQLADAPGQALFLKLDVQGAEAVVLRDGAETLQRTVAMRVELSLRPLYDGQADFLELLGLLRGQGFDVCQLLPGFLDPRSGDLLQADALLRRRTAAERADGEQKHRTR